MRNLIGKDELRNVSIELLFKDFDRRMSLAKDVRKFPKQNSLNTL